MPRTWLRTERCSQELSQPMSSQKRVPSGFTCEELCILARFWNTQFKTVAMRLCRVSVHNYILPGFSKQQTRSVRSYQWDSLYYPAVPPSRPGAAARGRAASGKAEFLLLPLPARRAPTALTTPVCPRVWLPHLIVLVRNTSRIKKNQKVLQHAHFKLHLKQWN